MPAVRRATFFPTTPHIWGEPMHWPQYVYLGLVVFGCGVELAQHGQSRGPHNALTQIVATAIAVFLLWAGGFFVSPATVWP